MHVLNGILVSLQLYILELSISGNVALRLSSPVEFLLPPMLWSRPIQETHISRYHLIVSSFS